MTGNCRLLFVAPKLSCRLLDLSSTSLYQRILGSVSSRFVILIWNPYLEPELLALASLFVSQLFYFLSIHSIYLDLPISSQLGSIIGSI